jgi:tryptophan halogenase|tara:strand:- start:22 stop:1317 length:1296 start_codon:yes stop_codon:yes gene_type:complete
MVRITVIGAGSAGLISALIIQNKHNSAKVTVIGSDKIPVIGVGESTVGSFGEVMRDHIGMDMNEFIREVNPTVKHGLWLDFGKSDFHYTFQTAFDMQQFNKAFPEGFYFKGGNYGHNQYSRDMINRSRTEPNSSSDSFNFDNGLFLMYLKKLATSRGIDFKEDTIKTIQREGDKVVSLNGIHKADYFIDCSGFNPLLSKEKWKSYEDTLVNDRALIFTRETGDKTRPYTKATTMNSGWLWEIDHSNRTGFGYVYSSKYITDDEALTEVQNKLKIKIQDYRIIPFKTGRLERHWVGNVITLGNTDGFVEPLEATSLMVIGALSINIADIIRYGDKMGDLPEQYNDFVNVYYDNIHDFILAHFIYNKKLDTKYWIDYRERKVLFTKYRVGSKILKRYLNNDVHLKFMSNVFDDSNPFGLEGWFAIFRGLDVNV